MSEDKDLRRDFRSLQDKTRSCERVCVGAERGQGRAGLLSGGPGRGRGCLRAARFLDGAAFGRPVLCRALCTLSDRQGGKVMCTSIMLI